MAKTGDNVYDLLNQIWDPAVEKAKEEIADIKAEMRKDGIKGEPQRWDYMYYQNKAKVAKFAYDEEKISEYLEINNVQQGIFYVANKLYGISFKERTQDYPVYESTAKSWDVIDKDGNAALFTGGGSDWIVKAKQEIADYFNNVLESFPNITVLA